MLQLELTDMHIGADGIAEYHWPVTQDELYDFRDALLKISKDYIQDLYKIDYDSARILNITYIEIIREMLMILRSDLLGKRLGGQGIEFNFSKETYPYLKALLGGVTLEPLIKQRLSYASKTVPNPSNFVKTVRPFKLMLGHPIYKRKTLSSIKETDIVTFSTSRIMERHADKLRRETGQRVTLCSLWEWYDEADFKVTHFDEGDQVQPAFKDYILALEECAANQGYDLSENIRKALRLFTAQICHYARGYREHLLNKKNRKKLPNILWFGSNNPIHPRVLRAAVQENGGKTVGHDHGRAVAAGVSVGELGTVFDFCDELVTYSEFLRDHSTTMQDDIVKYTPSEKPTSFSAYPGLFLQNDDVVEYRQKLQTVTANENQKTAMVIAGTFMGEGIAGLNVLPADITLMDFQIRLIQCLHKQGYKVLLKVHPENEFPMPKGMQDIPDLEIVGGYVEDCLGDVDLICFDFLSSAFKSIVLTDKPMIFFDYGWIKIPDAIQNCLEERIAIVKGRHDEQNRMLLDEDECASAIKHATQHTNRNTDLFLETFYDMV